MKESLIILIVMILFYPWMIISNIITLFTFPFMGGYSKAGYYWSFEFPGRLIDGEV